MADEADRIDQLYGLPLDEFTEARDRLVGELRAGDGREAAAEVKALRRPTLPAWAVNQLVRGHSEEVERLLSLREDLEAAQRAALSGEGVAALREVGDRRREVLDGLLQRAEAVLERDGHATSRSTMDRVEGSLMAATLDQEAAQAVKQGRLARELTPPSGFDSLAGDVPAPAKDVPARDRREAERARRAADEARSAEEAADRAESEARRMEREAERSRKEADRARAEADRAAAHAGELRRRAEELARDSRA